MSLPEHIRRGLRGEQLTARYLRDHGYEIVGANFLTKVGETDIIALKDKILCFVEVKTRAPGGMFPPSDAVDREKQERLISSALSFARYSKEEFDRLAAENKELLNQAMTLMYEQHQALANEDLLPSFESGKFYTDTTIRHQEMTAAAMMMQNVIDGTSDYSSLLPEVQDVNMLEGIEIADFEEVSKEDLEEAINEVEPRTKHFLSLSVKCRPIANDRIKDET